MLQLQNKKLLDNTVGKMKKITKFNKHILISFVNMCLLVLVASAFFMPSMVKNKKDGDNIYRISVNGTQIGAIEDLEILDKCVANARKSVLDDYTELTLMEVDVDYEAEHVLFGVVSSQKDLEGKIADVMKNNIRDILHKAYAVKIDDYTVNLASAWEVKELLQAVVAQYDDTGYYRVNLINDTDREINVLTADVTNMTPETEETLVTSVLPSSGTYSELEKYVQSIEPDREKGFNEFEYGLIDVEFGEKIEISECYVPVYYLTDLVVAIEQVTKEKETNVIYEVKAGDTLSKIAANNNMTVSQLVVINPTLTSESSTIRIGDELNIVVPEPELSVVRQEQVYYEESYEADVVYVDNDSWYTTQTKTLQEPVAGFHKVVAKVTYRNDEVIAKEQIKEEVVVEAVPKIVERGTIVPPTYIKPLSGGRLSSTFGRRKAPTKGASTYHKGVDWATPTGTAVVASSGGVVAKAGWGSGYGYVVYINHPDGRQTRYAHNSKVLVSVGQTVSQGQKIALSGNTGISSGPHVHFEMLIGGSQVNPLNYID